MTASRRSIAIVGAGIGGLTLGLALRMRGGAGSDRRPCRGVPLGTSGYVGPGPGRCSGDSTHSAGAGLRQPYEFQSPSEKES